MISLKIASLLTIGKIKNNVFEVEFCDKNGITLATIALEFQYLLQLHYEMETA